MGVFDFTKDRKIADKIRVDIVGGPRDPKPGPAGIYKDGKLVWSPKAASSSHADPSGVIRTFDTGATRSAQSDKLDFRGFLSPIALRAFAEYMHKNRVQPDGTVRASDNWQKGIPLQSYMESMWRHFFAVWEGHEKGEVEADDLAGLFFNVQGYMHEWGKGNKKAEVKWEKMTRDYC